jgi:hypothetical protein
MVGGGLESSRSSLKRGRKLAKQGLGNQSQIVSDRFASLLREEVAARKEEPLVFQVLKEHEDLVREARAGGLSFRALSEVLKKAGIEASPYEVREFCRTVLSEPARKRKRPGKKAAPAQKTSPLPHASALRPGLKLDRLNDASGSAAPKTVQTGKPGFRVARDEEL